MKKRLISLLVALCMAVTLLPVSAITAWAEEGGSTLKPLQIRSGYPVLDDITPTTDSQNHEIYTGDGWSYDATAKVLTIAPENPTTYDLKECGNIRLDPKSILCSAIIGENATIENGKFWDTGNHGSSITNDGTITSGVYSMHVINHGTITGGMFSSTVTNTGTIKGGIFHKKPKDGQVADGYTLKVNSQQNGSYESFDTEISYFGNSGYVIPNSDHDTSITIYISLKNSQAVLFPIDVTFGDSNDTHCLFEDWAPSARYHDDGSGNFSVTFTAPHAHAGTVTLSMLTRLVIDKDGYPVGTKGGTQDYSGNGWKFENDTLTLEPAAKTNYDFNSPELNPHRVAVNCPVTVNSNATITNGIFLKEVTGSASALNGVFLNVPTGCENSAKKITVSDNGTITALKTSGDITTLESSAKEIYVVGQPTGTLYVTLSSGKVREVQLPLTADLELRLNDPKPEPKPEPEPEPKPEPKPEPEPETYTLKVVGGSFTTGERDALTSGTVPVDAEAKVTLNPDAVPEGMVFDQWTISEESLLGNPNVAYNAESFTIPANAVENGKTVTVEAQYREATIESEGPDILGTAAIIGTAGAGAAVLGYTGYMIGTELYLNTVLPAGAAIPNNAGELALLLWEAAGTPAPTALLPADAAPVQQALAWAIENQLLTPDASAEDSVSRWEVIRSWNQMKG